MISVCSASPGIASCYVGIDFILKRTAERGDVEILKSIFPDIALATEITSSAAQGSGQIHRLSAELSGYRPQRARILWTQLGGMCGSTYGPGNVEDPSEFKTSLLAVLPASLANTATNVDGSRGFGM